MLRIGTTLIIAGVIIAIGCGNNVRVKTSYDEAATFDVYQTFAQAPPPATAPNLPGYSEITGRRIQDAIRKNLAAKGMTEAPWESADLLISMRVGGQGRTQVWDDSVGWYGTGNTWSTNYTEGSLVIEMVDRNKQRLVWHGWGSKDLFESSKTDEGTAAQVVDAILAKYPPQ